MGQIRRGSAATTAAVRPAIQHNQESLRPLPGPTALIQDVGEMEEAASAFDLKTGTTEAKSTVLSPRRKPSSVLSVSSRCCR